MTKPGARTKIENTGNIIAAAWQTTKRETRKKSLRSLIGTAVTARNPGRYVIPIVIIIILFLFERCLSNSTFLVTWCSVHLNPTVKTGTGSRGETGMVCEEIALTRILKMENSEMMGKFGSPLPFSM